MMTNNTTITAKATHGKLTLANGTTYYQVPGETAEAFEARVKQVVKEDFKATLLIF